MQAKSRVRSLVGGSIGNLVAWYDWYVYSAFALYFSKSFFPQGDTTAQLLNTAAVFAIGFLMRPIGGWWLGKYADVRGRKAALTLSVLLMCTGSLLIAVVPLFAAVIVTRLGHERLEPRRLMGLGIGFAGVALLVGIDIHFADLMAVAATMIVALCYAIGPIIISRKLADVPAVGVITASLIVATVIYAPFVPFLWPEQVPASAAWSVVGLGSLCTAAAFMVFFALIAEVGPARATVITYVNPAVAIVLGALVLSEPLTLGMAIGFPLVIAGSVLGTSRARPAH